MAANLCNPCCRADEIKQSSVVTRLLELQRFGAPNHKLAAFPTSFLQICQRHSCVLQLTRCFQHDSGGSNYVAVSYSWDATPKLECDHSGKYRIIGSRYQYLRQNQVRDEVITRVMRYARYHNITRFWIDKECIPQDEPEEKQIAMDSMDLVYSNSTYPVGLLATILETQDEVNKLQELMLGHLTILGDVGGYPTLRYPAYDRRSQAVFTMLRRLYADRWWTRAWIFQEEYLSSTKLYLLIRRKAGIAATREFAILPGEICINVADFREQATLFLLAFKRKICGRTREHCVKMLKRFGKYNVQYRFQHDAQRKAMSPRIFADIQGRDIADQFDRLPIAANSCNYAIRLKSQELSKTGRSLGLFLLALFLMNGEIIRNAQEINKLPTQMNVSNYLQYISFNKFDPPVKGKPLTYLKECRFQEVSLCSQGISTRGHLWKIQHILQPRKWCFSRSFSRNHHGSGLKAFQRDCLYQLVYYLKGCGLRFQFLGEEIESYLEQYSLHSRPSPAKAHMDLMAESVVEAIRSGMPLYIAGLYGSIEASGVFVGLEDPEMGVFTSWRTGTDKDGRKRQTHVSLGVEVEQVQGELFLRAAQWVNGLAFFKQNDQVPVIFRWPHIWMDSDSTS